MHCSAQHSEAFHGLGVQDVQDEALSSAFWEKNEKKRKNKKEK
jgi:hypothetical protein